MIAMANVAATRATRSAAIRGGGASDLVKVDGDVAGALVSVAVPLIVAWFHTPQANSLIQRAE
jgi:hypothetical protein